MAIRRLLVGVGALTALLLAPGVMAAPAVAGSAADEAAIARILADEGAAWARGDADAFAAHVTPDVVFTNIRGMFSIGKAPFVAQHHTIFTTIYQGSTARFVAENITFVDPATAIVSAVAKLTGFRELPPGTPAVDGALYTRLLQVMVKRGDGWQVAAFHNVVVAPPIVDEKVRALTAGNDR